MDIALIAYEFFPELGGIGQNFTSFCKQFRKTSHNLFVFNQYHKGDNIYCILDKLDKPRYKFRDWLIFIKRRDLLTLFIKSVGKILFDKYTKNTHKIMLILYLFIVPDVLIRTMKNLSHIFQYFEKYNFDLILGSASGSDILTTLYLLSRFFKKKVVSYAHGNEFLVKNKFSLKTYYLRTLDRLIVSNKRTKSLLQEINNIKEEKISIIPYGLILDDYKVEKTKEQLRYKFNFPNDQFILISVGRHVPRKNFQLVIKALYEIKKEKDLNIKYLLIGEGPETSKWKKLVNKLNLNDFVEFLGAFGGTKRNEYLKAADVFVMPSVALKESIEGFGIVFLEANYLKLPVIGSRSGGIIHAIKDEQTGFLIDPNDLENLKKKILLFYNNRDIVNKMGNMGHKRVVENFSWNKIIQEYIELFEKML